MRTYSFLLGIFCVLGAGEFLDAQTTKTLPPDLKLSSTEAKIIKPVQLDEGSWDDLKKYVAKQKGKVVVVDLWSTSCLPCMKEFPHLVELSRKYPRRVVCVSFSCDFYGVASKPPSYYRPNVEKFLRKKKATFKNFLSTTPSDDLFEKIDLASIPAVLVFGPDGKLAKRFDNDELEDDADPFSYKKQIIPLVNKLAEKVVLKKSDS
jgi:thiol-disulfide isomerase/thioredoxin